MDAGFTDINIVEKLIDIGGWNQGLKIPHFPSLRAVVKCRFQTEREQELDE